MNNENQPKINWKDYKFGAIWLKGNKYSGTVTVNGEQKRIIGFLKKPDDNVNGPDIALYFAPDDNGSQQNQAAQQQAPSVAPAPRRQQPAPQQNQAQSPANKPNRSLL